MRHEITSVGRERVMRLVEAGISSVGAILDAEPGKFRGILEGSVATQMRKDLEERIASRLERKRREHRRRMEAVAGDSVLLDKLYQMDGEALEIVVQDVLRSGCCPFPVERIAKQNEGEPDLLMRLPSGTGVISVTAKRDNRGQVSMKKAVEIIGTAARFRPSAYFVIGRPEFDALAVATAKEHVAAGQHFKLLPISALAEVFVAFSERRLSKEEVEKLLLRKQAHLVDSDILGG